VRFQTLYLFITFHNLLRSVPVSPL